ncbi:MAG: glycerol kinase [Candidatus Delongbacteria bacterium]|nr:glycerol kinase [Candidatus Delongbacteria bacterium]
MKKKYILGIDCGTSLIKVMIVNRDADQVGFGSTEIMTLHPKEGYAEQDPVALWDSVYNLILKTLSDNNILLGQIAAIGITNQRSSTIVWNKKTGIPYSNMVLWFDKRAGSLSEKLSGILGTETVERVGMYTIPNTSAMLLTWLLQNDPSVKEGVEKGEALFGTVNSWLLWKLTDGEVHCSDIANMSVTQFQNAKELKYDTKVLDQLDIPKEILPEIKGTGEIYGLTSEKLFFGERIPIAGMLGDQQAAVLGQGCIFSGMVKATFGTGCFCVMNVGKEYNSPANGLFSPVLLGSKKDATYSLEGFFEIEGDRDDEQILRDIAFQVRYIIKSMEDVSKHSIQILRIDGGMSENEYLCQFLADIIGIPVERPATGEATGLGAVYQAGLTIGFWNFVEETASLWKLDKRFEPKISISERDQLYSNWLRRNR